MLEKSEPSLAADDDQTWRQKAYDDIVAEVHKRQMSGSENYDKSILTLASAGLAVSIAFLKDFVPIDQAAWSWTLYWSWAAFTLSTITTIVSFLSSQSALERTKSKAYDYYLIKDDKAFDRSNWADRGTHWLNYLSGASVIAALLLSTAFLARNLEVSAMVKQTENRDHARDKVNDVQRGQVAPSMAKVPTPPSAEPKPAAADSQASAPGPADKKER